MHVAMLIPGLKTTCFINPFSGKFVKKVVIKGVFNILRMAQLLVTALSNDVS